MKFSFLFVLLLSFTKTFAQKELPKFGTIETSDLLMTSCPFEKDASAMVLFDVFEVEMDYHYDVKIVTERRVRIKIFDERGFEHGKIKIPYFKEKNSTKIKDFSGVVYNLDANGKVVAETINKKDIFKDNLVGSIHSMSFTFPNIKKGSVIEFRYTKVEKNILQFDPWILQSPIPTAYTCLRLVVPDEVDVFTKTAGFDSIPVKKDILYKNSYRPKKRFIYAKENIKSFKQESFMSSLNDNLLRLHFLVRPDRFWLKGDSNMSYWRFLGNMLMKDLRFGKQININIPGTESIIDSAKKISSIPKRTEYIYNRVQKQIPDVSGQTAYSNDVIEAWNDRNGSTGDINLILLNLLKKAAVKCYPLLVSTRENGMVAMDFPSLGQINGVDVVVVDSTDVFVMDASQKHSYNLPPLNVLNRNAFFMDPENMKWIYIDDPRTLQTVKLKITAEMDENGLAKGEALYQLFDLAREMEKDSIDEKETDKLFASKQEGVNIISVVNENTELINEPALKKVKFNYQVSGTDGFYYINPLFLTKQEKNPFIQKERQTDIDFGCKQKINIEFILSFPKNFTIEHIPQNIRMRSSDTTMGFQRMIFTDENTFVYRQEFEIKRAFFYKEEYGAVNQFFDKMFAYLKEEIILRKRK